MSLAALAATEQMISTIPVVVTGGIVMKFTEQMTNMSSGQRPRRRAARPRKRSRRSSSYGIGGADFSNIGF